MTTYQGGEEGVDYKYLTIAVALNGMKGGPGKELKCRQQQDRGGLWETS